MRNTKEKNKHNVATRKYRKKHPKRLAVIGRRARLKKKYDITLVDYDRMFEKQNGVCAICSNPETRKGNGGNIKPLGVDHDHASGKIRGLLCQICNTRLGHLENLEFITKARLYLDTYTQKGK